MIEKDFLVSVIVITYNSSKYVIETLNSIKRQSYGNIELIISDDCSLDNTLSICSDWLSENSDRFVRTEIISVEKNTGITPNCNRGLQASKGRWIKFIAGDDLLAPNAISDFISFIHCKGKDVKIICGGVVEFLNVFTIGNFRKIHWDDVFFKESTTARSQLRLLALYNRVPAVGVFVSRDVLFETVNGFDERFVMMEDYPLWIRLASLDIKIHGMPQVVAYYRIHDACVIGGDSIIKRIAVNENFRKYRKDEKLFLDPYLSFIGRFSKKYEYTLSNIIYWVGNDRDKIIVKFLLFLRKKLNPLYLLSKIGNYA